MDLAASLLHILAKAMNRPIDFLVNVIALLPPRLKEPDIGVAGTVVPEIDRGKIVKESNLIFNLPVGVIFLDFSYDFLRERTEVASL